MSEESFPNIEICFRETYIYSLNYKGWFFFLFYINWYPQRSVRSLEIVVPGGCAGIKYRSSGIAACALYWGTISPAPLFLVYGSRALLFSLGWPQAQDLPSQPPKWWGHKELLAIQTQHRPLMPISKLSASHILPRLVCTSEHGE